MPALLRLARLATPLLTGAAFVAAALTPCPGAVERVEHEGHVHAVVDARGAVADAEPWLVPLCSCGCEKRLGGAASWSRTGPALPRLAPEAGFAAAELELVFAGATLPRAPVFGVDPVPI